MRRVELGAVIRGTAPGPAYDAISHFERFPELVPYVRSTTVHSGRPGRVRRSSWEMQFQDGLLCWTEEDRFYRDQLLIDFERIDGDFGEFGGTWALSARGPDTTLAYTAEFDLGIPELKGLLEPIAERVITESVCWYVVGLFDEVDLTGQQAPSSAPDR
jgi:ribosome-associated toxin RatA of RatAB toxin-antitoxin module